MTTDRSAKVTGADVARVAQVSIGTVNRVLTNQPNVNDELRARVIKVVEELGYVHVPKRRAGTNGTEQPATSGAVRTVTFCVPLRPASVLHDAYFFDILHGIEDECAANGIDVVYTVLPDAVGSISQIMEARQRGMTDGVVLVNYGSNELIEQIAQLPLPVVVVDPRRPLGLEVDLVLTEYLEGSKLAMQHLLGLGHREIALVNGPDRFSMRRRFDGYRLALMDAGLPFRPELVVSIDGPTTVEAGEHATRELLARAAPFSAVFATTDALALGALRALSAAGLRIPADVSIVGFENRDAAAIAIPALTTVDADTRGKGRTAVQRLLDRVAHPRRSFAWSVLPVQFVERESTAPPASRP